MVSVGILLPIHDKPLETLTAVLDAIVAQQADEVVLVHDRCPEAVMALCDRYSSHTAHRVVVPGPTGWRSPCVSFNAGLEHMTTDITIINHSDIQQMPGNIDVVREHFNKHPDSVLFGMVLESKPEELKGPSATFS